MGSGLAGILQFFETGRSSSLTGKGGMSQRADSSTELSDKNNSFTAGRCFDSLPNGAGFIIFKG